MEFATGWNRQRSDEAGIYGVATACRDQATEGDNTEPTPAANPGEEVVEEDPQGLANLEVSLRPVERYAVRWLETVRFL